MLLGFGWKGDIVTNSKARRQRKIVAEKAAVERRLKNAVAINPDGPVLGRANIAYELAERTRGWRTAAWG
jgi:hypothetical protein